MLPDTVASSHIWRLSTLNGDTVTRELNFRRFIQSHIVQHVELEIKT